MGPSVRDRYQYAPRIVQARKRGKQNPMSAPVEQFIILTLSVELMQ